jgi:hypothetical protein
MALVAEKEAAIALIQTCCPNIEIVPGLREKLDSLQKQKEALKHALLMSNGGRGGSVDAGDEQFHHAQSSLIQQQHSQQHQFAQMIGNPNPMAAGLNFEYLIFTPKLFRRWCWPIWAKCLYNDCPWSASFCGRFPHPISISLIWPIPTKRRRIKPTNSSADFGSSYSNNATPIRGRAQCWQWRWFRSFSPSFAQFLWQQRICKFLK